MERMNGMSKLERRALMRVCMFRRTNPRWYTSHSVEWAPYLEQLARRGYCVRRKKSLRDTRYQAWRPTPAGLEADRTLPIPSEYPGPALLPSEREAAKR